MIGFILQINIIFVNLIFKIMIEWRKKRAGEKMSWLEKLKENNTARRVLVFILIGVVLYLLRSMIDLILLTFIFAFLVTRLENVILKRVRIPRKLIVIVLYTLVALFLYVAIVHFYQY